MDESVDNIVDKELLSSISASAKKPTKTKPALHGFAVHHTTVNKEKKNGVTISIIRG